MSALLVAVVMMAVTVVPAFAADVNVDWNADENGKTPRTLVAYQIFSGTVDDEKQKDTLGNLNWGGAFKDVPTVQTTFIEKLNEFLGANNQLVLNASAKDVAGKINQGNAEKVAQAAYEAIQKLNKDQKATYGQKLSSEPSNLDMGYYVILDETEGNLSDGESYNPAVLEVVGTTTIKPKTNPIEYGKKVLDGEHGDANSDKIYNDSADYSIGDEVPFRLYAQIPSKNTLDHYTEYYLEITDTASDGLDLPSESDIEVYIANNENGENKELIDFGEVSINGQTLKITFNDLIDHKGKVAGKYIVVEYKATLNNKAEFRNNNKVHIEYSNNPNNTDSKRETPDETVYVYTFTLDGTKKDDEDQVLKEAEFIISRQRTDGTFEYANVVNGKINKTESCPTGWLTWSGNKEGLPENGNIKSDESGKFNIAGLDAGTYHLWEVKAPNGYNTPEKSFEIKITAEHSGADVTTLTLEIDDESIDQDSDPVETGKLDMTILNTKGTTLPETGGMGTTLLYVAGGILLIGSAVLLVTKKRMGHEN